MPVPRNSRPASVKRRATPATRAAASFVALVATLALAPAAVGHQASSAAAATDETLQLPFDMPTGSTLRVGNKVFAHYVPWYPLSLDNKLASVDYYTRNYVAINGEGGKYASHGGLMRDRPFTRDPIPTADWRLADMKTEIRQAQSAGLDGFTVSMTSVGTSATAVAVKTLLTAAEQVGNFSIVLRPNPMSDGISKLTPAQAAKGLAELTESPAAYRLPDGRVVVSPYRAELMSVDWWTATLSLMKTDYGVDVAFWPMFLNEQTWGPAFAELAHGEATWGERTAANNDVVVTHKTSIRARVDAVRARGDQWMQPVSLQDARPVQDLYYEPENTENLRRTWTIALETKADAVHIPTWNDYAEGSQVAPTAKVGWAPLDINAYYLTWFKTGRAPEIVRDAVYVSNRTQLSTTKPSAGYPNLMKPTAGTVVHDEAEALVFSRANATVSITSGSSTNVCQVPPGISTCKVRLEPGDVKASVVREGVTVASVASSRPVLSTPTVQDMDYVYTSSLRSGTGTPPGYVPPASSIPPPPPVEVAVSASDDTYVNSMAPSTNYGSSSSMATRGGGVSMDAYLRFKIPAAPAGKTLVKAQLKYWVASSSTSGSVDKASIVQASDAWDEATVTSKTRPALSLEELGTTAPSGPDTPTTVPLSTDKTRGLVGKQITLALHSSSSDDLRIWSSEFEGERQRPQLLLTYDQ